MQPSHNDVSPRPTHSVAVPVFHEAEVVGGLHRRLKAAMDGTGETREVVYANDGSRNTTLPHLEALQNSAPEVALVYLSRNFGKEIATTAGLDQARAGRR